MKDTIYRCDHCMEETTEDNLFRFYLTTSRRTSSTCKFFGFYFQPTDLCPTCVIKLRTLFNWREC